MRFANGLTTILVLFLAAMGIQAPTMAATFNVNNAADLRSALLTAATNGEDDVIALAAGNYYTLGTTFTFVTNETNTLTLQGASGTTRDQVVLDGGGTSQVLNFSCIGSCASMITLQGLIVQNGSAGGLKTASPTLTLSDVSFSGNATGGAISSNTSSNTVTVTNSTFSNNTGGSAISGGIITVTNSTFSNNTGGSAISGSTLTVTNSTFSNNTGSSAISGVAVTVTNSTFSNNSAGTGGGAIIGGKFSGGGVTVTNSTFSNNMAGAGGGAISAYLAGLVTVTNSTFSGNTSVGYGGAISGYATVTNSTFRNNTAGAGGGAIGAQGGYGARVANSTFISNTAGAGGGAIYGSGTVIGSLFINNWTTSWAPPCVNIGCLSPVVLGSGGAIYGSVPLTIVNNTFSGNSTMGMGAAIYLSGGVGPIINSVFYGETTPDIYSTSAYNFYDNLINTLTGIAGSTPIMVGNVAPGATSPFVDAANGNFQLAAGSPAIDAGLDPNSTTFANLVGSSNLAAIRAALQTDLQGNRRPAPGTAVDIGAYEYSSIPSGTIPGGVMTVFGSRGNVTPTTPMYGSFALVNPSVMYIAVRGPSLGILGYTNNPLNLPNVRVYDASGHDVLINQNGGVTVSGCPSSATVNTYYANFRGGTLDVNDTCVSATLPAGVYTFTINPNTSSSSGELLFEVTVNPTPPSGGVMTVFGTRGTVTPTAPMYGGFAIANSSVMYIAVRGPSLGTLGYTQNPLDLPNVRVYDASGKDVLTNASSGVTVSGCPSSSTVANYYATVRGGALDANDTCVSKTLDAGVYTFTINPNTSSSSGELLFEVTVNP